MRKIFLLIVICSLFCFIGGCDKGIEPEPENPNMLDKTGFSGKVTFTGNWPADIKRTHIFVFKNPILSSQDFSFENLGFVVDSIPYRSSEFIFNSVQQNYISRNFLPTFDIPPGDHSYVVVAQSTTPEISFDRKDWVIVGVYNIGGDQSKPKVLTIQNGKMTAGVDIIVDFNNPPPQPPM